MLLILAILSLFVSYGLMSYSNKYKLTKNAKRAEIAAWVMLIVSITLTMAIQIIG